MASSIDARAFRNALGNFATGVTVVTARNPATGERVGVTANSFNSVSMDPPLVLWSIDRNARSLDAFSNAQFFAVNVLSADQVSLSNHFATKGEDKFAQMEFAAGQGDAPLLEGCAARFQCRKAFEYDGGDHIILVGEVVEFDDNGRAGLLYHRGAYAVSGPHPASVKPQATNEDTGFVANYVDYLLASAANRFQLNFQHVLDSAGISQSAWRIMATLSDLGSASVHDISAHVLISALELEAPVAALLTDQLIERDEENGQLSLTQAGTARLAPVRDAARAHEIDALGEFTSDEAEQLKSMLKRLINWVESSAPPVVAARKASTH